MSEKWMGNNRVCVIGKIVSEFNYSHEMYGERLYRVDILVYRTSGVTDAVPLMVSERLMEMYTDKAYSREFASNLVEIVGKLRSYNRYTGEKRRLELFVFVQGIRFLDEEYPDCENNNRVSLKGLLCKEPACRKTPLGREICDILLAVNRPYGKSDYIPCIVWGENAVQASGLDVGSAVNVAGRIQSREYIKKLSKTQSEVRVAYEVSVCRLEADSGL